jgi:peptidoglycan/LPS O-acetylase OafA/YrhL
MLLCDLEQTFAVPLKCLNSSRHWPTVTGLWALRAALLYAWIAASWWQLKYLDDTAETRLVVGSVSALALLALSPPLQTLFRSRPFHFLGACRPPPPLRSSLALTSDTYLSHSHPRAGCISFSLYLWHLTVLFSLGSWTFVRLYLERHTSYAYAVGAAGGVVLVVAIAVAYVATKAFDEPSVKFAKWVVDSLFTPFDEGNTVHRFLRRVETCVCVYVYVCACRYVCTVWMKAGCDMQLLLS